jgi:hypothetical protein
MEHLGALSYWTISHLSFRRLDFFGERWGPLSSMRILVVDDYEPVGRGLRSLLSSRTDWSVCGEAVDGLEAVEKASTKVRPRFPRGCKAASWARVTEGGDELNWELKYSKYCMGLLAEGYYPCATDYRRFSPTFMSSRTWNRYFRGRSSLGRPLAIGDEDRANSHCRRS